MKLSKHRTKTKFIPIADCPGCGLKDTPLSQTHTKMQHKDTGKIIDLHMIVCPKCDVLFNLDKETMKLIKGYVSLKQLKDMGYTEKEQGANP